MERLRFRHILLPLIITSIQFRQWQWTSGVIQVSRYCDKGTVSRDVRPLFFSIKISVLTFSYINSNSRSYLNVLKCMRSCHRYRMNDAWGIIDTACTVGWVDIGTRTKVPLKFVTYLSKITKINEESFLTQWPLHHWSKSFGSCTI
jgi:hypothetical protein